MCKATVGAIFAPIFQVCGEVRHITCTRENQYVHTVENEGRFGPRALYVILGTSKPKSY